MDHNLLQTCKQAVIHGDEATAADLARQWLAAGCDPLELVEKALGPGITEVGRLWECGDYFLPELVTGAEAMKAAMSILEPALLAAGGHYGRGTVVIGTVQGDIHDIGKTLVATMLRAAGFTVEDLGADVEPERFIEAQQRTGAQLICLSALLTTTMTGIPELMAAFRRHQISVRFMVGGAPVTRDWAEEIGADGYADDAVEAVRAAAALLGGTR